MYTKKYGLTKLPFENTPDPDFLFLSDCHSEVLSSLIYGIKFAKGFTLFSGDVGTGKTTLLYALLKRLTPDKYIIINIFNPRTGFNLVVKEIARRIDINISETLTFEVLDVIREKLIFLEQKGKKIILVIDEAHLLSESSLEDIRLISNIETEKKKLIQIILAGQNEVHELLSRPSPEKRVKPLANFIP